MDRWNALSHPPASALRQIQAGRLRGKTDINPQWRYQAMTEVYGPCGVGWRYTIERLWQEAGTEGQICAFAAISLYVRDAEAGEYGDAIPGVGGSMLVAAESGGLHTSDEAYKMAITDALSVAMKMLGVGAAVYAGAWDGSKYNDAPEATHGKAPEGPQDAPTPRSDARHADAPEPVNAGSSCVNAGASRVKGGAAAIVGCLSSAPEFRTITVKGVEQEIVEFYVDGVPEHGEVKIVGWHEGRDYMRTGEHKVGDVLEITGRWDEYRGAWKVNTNDIRDGIPW